MEKMEELQLTRIRQRIADATANLQSLPPLYWPQWAFDILALAASMSAKPWRVAWRECRKLLPKDRQQYLGRHHLPKKAAFRCWLDGEVVIPDRWKVRP